MDNNDFLEKKDVIALIAEKLKYSVRHVADRIIKRPDFPAPRKQVGRRSVYSRHDVDKWLRF